MSVFSKRYGYSEDQGIQYECVGKRLRNRLWNHFFSAEYDADPFNRDDDSLTNIEHLMDGLGLTFNIPRSPTARAANAKKLREYVFDETKWYLIYDLIERYVGLFDKTTQRELCKEFNEVLEDECSGYRFVKGLITPITNKEEIKTIEKATNTKYSAVNTHISKALVLFSDRLKHDYENMPDIGMLVEMADFFDVSIPEIVSGERKSENMNKETRDTAVAMAEYGRNAVKKGKQKAIGILMSAFGIFIIVSALSIFPSDSSWGSIYSVLGSIFLVAGIYLIIRPVVAKRGLRILTVLGCVCLLFGAFALSDYIAVKQFSQVPRFRYATSYDSRYPDQLVHKTIFFTAVQKNPGTENEKVFIVK